MVNVIGGIFITACRDEGEIEMLTRNIRMTVKTFTAGLYLGIATMGLAVVAGASTAHATAITTPTALSPGAAHFGIEHLDLYINQLIAARVCQPEHQRRTVLVGCDQRIAAEQDFDSRARKPRKEQPSCQRKAYEANKSIK